MISAAANRYVRRPKSRLGHAVPDNITRMMDRPGFLPSEMSFLSVKRDSPLSLHSARRGMQM